MKKIFAGILAMVMSVTMMPGNLMEKAGVKEDVEAAVALQDPRIVSDASMESGQKVTYDCIWFGSYPQTEIVDQASTSGAYQKSWSQNTDYEENNSLYTTLQNASGWDSNGDIIISGIKYRRIKSTDAMYIENTSGYQYTWDSSDAYHFFRYEPIKWRVLDVDDDSGKALLLADRGLDDQQYNKTKINITWKTSTIRSWLNGYGASINTCAIDYTNKNFINSAFSSEEKGAILSTDLDNETTGEYTGIHGGDDTTDKVFLLSSYDLCYTDKSASYGFYKDSGNIHDEARYNKSSIYAIAMGVGTDTTTDYLRNGAWWLRSPGYSADEAMEVHRSGDVIFSSVVQNYVMAVRPALNLNLSSSDFYSYAGTVCSDGTVYEEGGGDVTPTTYSITYDANWGTGAPQSQIKTRGEDLILSLTEPTRDGYTFMGWGTTRYAKTVKYGPGEIYISDSSITLYAIWKKTVTLSYNANGGNEAPSSQTGDMYNGETSTILTISSTKPTKGNNTFLGWSTSSTATSASYTGGNSISISEDTTLYAVWQENPSTGYTITYNANGGNGAPSPQTKDAGESITLSTTKPTRNDYEFAGWTTDNTSTDVDFDPGVSYDDDENLILYAIWKKTITLSYNANGGKGGPSEKSVIVYNSEKDYTFTISSIEPSRTGYDFLGWGIRSNSEYPTYYSGDEITTDTDTMIYAVWLKNSSGETDGGDSDNDDPIPQPKPKATQTITAFNKNIAINSKPESLGAKTSGNGKLTYKSSNTKVATISSAGTIAVKGYGITNITINAAETLTFKKTSKIVTITVVPKKMKLKSVKSPKKGQLQIIWKKDKAADGYQIQFSRDMNFKKGVYQKAVSKKLVKLKKPVTGLISKKRYYVRMRSYKKITGKKLYGIWSYGKVIKVK